VSVGEAEKCEFLTEFLTHPPRCSVFQDALDASNRCLDRGVGTAKSKG